MLFQRCLCCLALIAAGAPSQEPTATFKASVNVVMVPAVVRDNKGRAVGNLSRDDFELLDNGKCQVISRFTVERAGGAAESRSEQRPREFGRRAGEPAVMPERFVAYVFDDLHMEFGDMARLRAAATKHFREALQPGDRAAIYSTSGHITLDFTTDRVQLAQTLVRLTPRPISQSGAFRCPNIGYYQADLIENRQDRLALQAAVQEVLICLPNTPPALAEHMAEAEARSVVAIGNYETRATLSALRNILRRMSVLPGQRALVFSSPGFLKPDLQQEASDVMDRAIRAKIKISTLDARGVWVDPTFSASRGPLIKGSAEYERTGLIMQDAVLAELASGTGGRFFHNDNDLEIGLRHVAAVPEYVYMLGFSPLELKPDGKYHNIKVVLKNGRGLNVDARKGYFAPNVAASGAEQAKQEIRDAVFARDELGGIPVRLDTQFFRTGPGKARFTVLARLALRDLQFRKVDGRNANELTVVSTLFDDNGNLLTGQERRLELRLKDETVQEKSITVRSPFDIKPGSYLVRLVVRDAEGKQVSAQSGAVEIPADGQPAARPPATKEQAQPAQAPFFYTSPNTARVHAATEVPGAGIKFAGSAGAFHGEMYVLGTAYTESGEVAARFTDTLAFDLQDEAAVSKFASAPLRYENQFEAAPGQYTVRIMFGSGGSVFAQRELALAIDPHNNAEFAMSGLAVSKAFYPANGAPPDPSAEAIAERKLLRTPNFVFPLAGTNRFRKTDEAGVYVEIASRLPGLNVWVRVLDRKTGELVLDSGPLEPMKPEQPTTAVVPVGLRLPLDRLEPGGYRVEVEARDADGHSGTRSADFDVIVK